MGRILLALASACGCAPAPAPATGDVPERPPNVVLIVADDAGYADFSFQGGTDFATPRLDALAAQSVRCAAAYASSSVCSPSRAGLLTGRYQQRFGHEYNLPNKHDPRAGLPEGVRTLADLLRARGYATEGVGKWHLGATESFHPCARGFDHFYGFLHGARSYFPRKEDAPRHRLHGLVRDWDLADEEFDYLTRELGREAVAVVERHREERFFLLLSFSAPHVPLQAPAESIAAFEELEGERRTLAAMMVEMDAAVGAVLDALERHGIADDTLVVFTNDNGGSESNAASNAPLRGAKGTPFDGGVRVPLLLRWPGVLPAGTTYAEPVSLLDVVPTVLAAAGAEGAPPAGDGFDGIDLLPCLRGTAAAPPRRSLFWRHGPDWAVRSGPWKLVGSGESEPQLFQLELDPGESRDVSGEHPEHVERLAAEHAAWASTLAEPGWRTWVGEPGADEDGGDD